MPLSSNHTSTDRYYMHTARAGETWDSIAFDAYLEEREASTIIKANIDMAHVVRFEGGEKVRVPVIEKVYTAATLPPWRKS